MHQPLYAQLSAVYEAPAIRQTLYYSLGNQVNKTCVAYREGSIINKLRAPRCRPRFTWLSEGVDILTQIPFCALPNLKLSRVLEL